MDNNKFQEDYINQRWGQLYSLEKELGERALRYLMLTNSGGAIATLSFLGSSQSEIDNSCVKIALLLFVIGIILVGISTARAYHHMSSLFDGWREDVTKYRSEPDWNELINADNERAVTDFLELAIPYASFGCFILGCILGGYGLFV